jgi:hypothetical protein
MHLAEKPSDKRALSWLLKKAREARAWILLSVAAGLGSGLLLIVQARFLSRIVHNAIMEKRSIEALWPLFAIGPAK